MPRGKRGGSGARRGNFTPRGGRGNPSIGTSFIPFAGTYIPQRPHSGFTLQDEARNTERHQSFWDTDLKLRHTRVNFVSAGELTPPDLIKDSEEALAEMSLESPNPSKANLAQNGQTMDESHSNEFGIGDGEEDNFEEPSSFMIDIIGSNPIETGLPPPHLQRLRSVSPARSDSSEEVILFHGRGQPARKVVEDTPIVADPIDTKIKLVEDKLVEQRQLLEKTLRSQEVLPQTSPEVADPSSPNFEAILPRRSVSNKHRNHSEDRRWAMDDAEDAMIADYIANMDQEESNDEIGQTLNRRELGGDDDAVWQDVSSAEPDDTVEPPTQHGWGRTELEDLDDLSTSDEARGKVQTVLSKRERATGIQYLIVWENQDVDEARWVSINVLEESGALPLIEVFEAEEKLVAEFQSNGEEDTDDSDETDEDDDDDHDDEQDLIQRRIDRMDDEQIARILAKQEELGMGGDEILLFDDEVDDDDDDEQETETRTTIDLDSFILSGKRGKKGKQRRQDEFPAAAALADAYDGFDVMDFDRPGLQKKPKGRKGKLILDISDSELEASMQSAWENDRSKKKERKKEREILRAQGLLTGKNGKPDLKAKYKEGMGIYAVKEEIKHFLMGGNTTLSLPPMDKADRKVVHEIANAFKLKSKSAGAGKKRYPILYRTSRTSVYVERTFEQVEARLARRFLPRNDVGGRRTGAVPTRRTGGGGFGNAAVSYRDGDIVGGSAPELGVENKGRAMLEKMGWSSGTALGALNNKGILQPVSHVVKTTKAGLG